MSGFISAVKFATEFEGDTVSMMIGHLNRKDVQSLVPYITETDGDVKMTFKEQIDFLNAFGDIVPRYITEFDGPKDIDGKAVALDVVLNNVYFTELFNTIVGKLMEISRMGKRTDDSNKEDPEIKKSDAPPDES